MRDYQRQKNNEYILPKSLYKMTLAFIRDHDRKLADYNNNDESPPPPDGLPRATNIGKPTEQKAIKAAELKISIDAVDNALKIVPEEYRKGVWNNIINYSRYPDDASPRTYAYHKQKFIYQVAKNMLWI